MSFDSFLRSSKNLYYHNMGYGLDQIFWLRVGGDMSSFFALKNAQSALDDTVSFRNSPNELG